MIVRASGRRVFMAFLVRACVPRRERAWYGARIVRAPPEHKQADRARTSARDKSHTNVCRCLAAGHTLVEFLVSLVVLGTLLSLVVSFLVSGRGEGRRMVCLSNMRGGLVLHLDHASLAQDRFVNAGPSESLRVWPAGEPVRVGGTRGPPNGLWAIKFPDLWVGDRFSKSLRCAKDPAWARDAPGTAFGTTSFWMSNALWLDARTLWPGFAGELRWAGNRVGDVAFPSTKVLLFEQITYCETASDARADIEIGHTPQWPGATGFVDGSARRLRRADGIPGVGSLPFEMTPEGVGGCDVIRGKSSHEGL